MERKLTLKDLYVGMKIKDKYQLSNIYDTWIILTRKSLDDDYTVAFIGPETNSQSDELFKQNIMICPVFNDSIELEGDMYYDE